MNWFRRVLLLVLVPVVVSACSTPVVDEVYQAQGQDSRIRYIVLHYTAGDAEEALQELTRQQVSAHYLITDESPVRVLQLVDDNERAWHAGESQWRNDVNLNFSSIGIEIVNLGPLSHAGTVPMSQDEWQPYKGEQIDRLIRLVKVLQQRYHIRNENILGHSDIAPQRKIDPGPVFPWRWLAQEGVGRWYDETRVARLTAVFQQQGLPSSKWVQQKLRKIGYAIEETGEWDEQSKRVLRAFQMHYRPSSFGGRLDAETAAILEDLTQP